MTTYAQKILRLLNEVEKGYDDWRRDLQYHVQSQSRKGIISPVGVLNTQFSMQEPFDIHGLISHDQGTLSFIARLEKSLPLDILHFAKFGPYGNLLTQEPIIYYAIRTGTPVDDWNTLFHGYRDLLLHKGDPHGKTSAPHKSKLSYDEESRFLELMDKKTNAVYHSGPRLTSREETELKSLHRGKYGM